MLRCFNEKEIFLKPRVQKVILLREIFPAQIASAKELWTLWMAKVL